MKHIRFLTFILAIGTFVLSACGATAAPTTPTDVNVNAAQKVQAMPVAFVGIVESMTGDQWVISGTTVKVDDSIVRDGPFQVGDRVKVEGFTNPDGTFKVSRVEAPSPQDAATQPPLTDNSNDAISNANTNDTNINDDHGTDVNTNDDSGGSLNSNDASTNINEDNSSSVNSNDASTNVNDDHGGNSTTNSNDDKGGGSNSNDGNGNGG